MTDGLRGRKALHVKDVAFVAVLAELLKIIATYCQSLKLGTVMFP
jgi:hypothetical protein